VKAQKVNSRVYKGKAYDKYRVVIPGDLLKTAGIKEGDILKAKADKGKIVLEKI